MIKEWILVSDQDFVMPNLDDGVVVGKVKTTEGIWEVIKVNSGHEFIFGVKEPETDRLVCCLDLLKWDHPYVMAKNIMTLKGFTRRGLATALVDFVTKKEKLQILSDVKYTRDGTKLWLSLLSHSRSQAGIADLKLGKIYHVSDAGKLAIDGAQIIKPEDDSRLEPRDFSDIKQNEQRFFYLIGDDIQFDVVEAESSQKTELVKGVNFVFGIPQESPLGESILQRLIAYGPGIDMP